MFNKINKFIPKQLYITNKSNWIPIVFILLIALVSLYPTIFSKSFNTIFGKAILLLLVILLTNYNTVVGLIVTAIILINYVYFVEVNNEGFENKQTETPSDIIPKSEDVKNGKPIASQPASVENSTDSLIKPESQERPINIPQVVTQNKNSSGTNQTELMLNAKEITKPEDSKKLLYTASSSTSVSPSEPTGAPKSTISTLKPSITATA